MRLVIVESPNKVDKIQGFLDDDCRVAASFGHVRDLPRGGGLAVRFAAGRVEPTYEPLEKSSRAVAQLRRLAAAASEVLLATDPDREGEAIAWHVAALFEAQDRRKCRRVCFHAITASAVRQAMASPRAIDQHLVDAQQARRVLDRVVGWLVSPTLRSLGPQARSAGRVQSVAARLVCDRERDIQAFIQEDFLVLDAVLERPGAAPRFTARLARWKGEPIGHRLQDAAVAERTVAWCRRQPWQVLSTTRTEQAKPPPPPFTTATVQQAASVRLKQSPEETMRQLQALFEAGHITYHRTDATSLSPEAVAMARAVIAARFDAPYLPPGPVVHGSAALAQEAHEAIRPTEASRGPDGVAGAGTALYALIWERFVACQMAAGRDAVSTISVACAPEAWEGGPMGIFEAKGVVVLFDGWRALGADATDEAPRPRTRARATDEQRTDGVRLPLVARGDQLTLRDLVVVQRTTRPPPRFTQASLIKRLEREGVGRPSTYATILATILDRGYVAERKRLLHGTEVGMGVTDFLTRQYAGNFIDVDFTRRMEEALDQVASGATAWEPLVTRAAEAVLRLAQAAGLRGNPLQSP
jgi:DNA topoisomerase I